VTERHEEAAPSPPRREPTPPLAVRFSARAWVGGVVAFLLAYAIMFVVVHPIVDTRVCSMRLDDPMFTVIPRDLRFYAITHDVYYAFNAGGTLILLAFALRGRQAPLYRWLGALTAQALLRSLTLLAVPLCRATQQPGTAPLAELPTVDLGFVTIPFRSWATNDLMFSGHVGEFVILSLLARGLLPKSVQALLLAFQLVQAYGLIATRGHYTIDILVAIPCAVLALALATLVTRRVGRAAAARDQAP
jgi:hypothetical protein